MLRYVPEFVLINAAQNKCTGTLDGFALFVDIVGFTDLSNSLRRQGKKGAEALNNYLSAALSLPIETVHDFGGFVSHFAGDAFCALFPDAEPAHIKSVLDKIRHHFSRMEEFQTDMGSFPIRAHVCASFGKLSWRIFYNNKQNEYVFSGQPLVDITTLSQLKKDFALSDKVLSILNDPEETPNKPDITHYEYSDDTLFSFLNPKFRSLKLDNEIRDAAYCFINLSHIEADKIDATISMIHEKLDNYGGFLNKLDASDKGLIALVLFGLPKAIGNTLERACRFSLELVNEFPALAIGLSCGNAYAGYVGTETTREFTALGAAVNLASRLMQTAEIGEIITDSYLEQEMHYKYSFKSSGTISLKGFTAPVNSHRLVDRLPAPPQSFMADLIGREAEVELIQRAVSEEGSKILYISGEPGIGKSRLILEALKPYPKRYFLFCDPSGHRYLEPIKQFLRQYFAYDPLLSESVNLRNFRDKWQALAGSDKELQRIESIIGDLLGFEWQGSIWSLLPPEQRPEQQKNAFATLVASIAEREAILIHLDDPQWLETIDAEYIRQLGAAMINRITIIAACRYRDDGSAVDLNIPNWESQHQDLNSLGYESSAKLIQHLLKVEQLPQDTLDWIVNKSDGNPLFIEQVVAYLRENNCFDSALKLKGNLDYLSSFGIADIIGSRIDSLTEVVRNTLQHACVLGLEFNTRVLSEMLTRKLDDDLGEGKQARVWADVDELRYIFTHVLIKDTAYNRMLRDKLQKLHLLAAEAMEKLQSETNEVNSQFIAYHFEHAGVLEKARDHYLTAGIYYRECFAFERAESNLMKALEISKQLNGEVSEAVADVLSQMQALHRERGEYQLSKSICEDVLQLYSSTIGTTNEKYAIALITYFFVLVTVGKLSEAFEALTKAEAICSKICDTTTELSIRVLYNKGIYYKEQGKFIEAIELLERVIHEDHTLGLSTSVTAVKHFNDLAVCYGNLGQLDKTEEMFSKAYDSMSKLLGIRHPNTAQILMNLGVVARMRGQLSKAEKHHKDSMDIYKEVYGTEHPETCDVIGGYANVLYFQERYDECIALMQQVLNIERRLGSKRNISASLSDLGNMLTSIERYEEGIACYLESVEIKKQILGADHIKIALTLENIGMTYLVMNELEKAISTYIEANEMLRRLYGETNHELGKTEYLIACAYEKLTRFAEAEKHYLCSIRIYEDTVGENSELIVPALINYSSFLDVVNRHQEAIEVLLRAYAVIGRNGDVINHEHYKEIVVGLTNLYDKCGMQSEAEKFTAMLKQIDNMETQ